MSSGAAAALASFLLAIQGATGFIVGVGVCRLIATRGVRFAMNAIVAPLPVLPTKAATLIAEFLESIGGGCGGRPPPPGWRRRGVVQAVLAHC